MQQPTPPPEPKPTLEFALRPHAVSTAAMLERYPAVVPLVARMLGTVPRVFGYLEIWPPAFQTYSIIVPAFMDIPVCDAGLGIGPGLRSLTAYATSRGHGCMYCTAHCAAIGTVFGGPRGYLARNVRAIQEGVCAIPEPRERAVVEYALAVAQVPGPVPQERLEALRAQFRRREIEKIALVAAGMGLLNRCLDTLGMVLELPMLELANRALTSTGWQEGSVYDSRFDQTLLDDDRRTPALPELGPVALATTLVSALRYEARSLRGLSGSPKRLDAQFDRSLGFVPGYVDCFGSQRVRRALGHLVLERLASESGALSRELRAAMCLVAARASRSPVLSAHFAWLGVRFSSLLAFERLLGEPWDPTTREGLALEFAQAASAVPHRVDAELVSALTARFSPSELIELVLTLSIYSALHRISLTFPAARLEPAVDRFVHRHGATFGLAALDAG